MSTIYKVIAGDTFEIISRNRYGTETESSKIARANPGVSEPLTAGITLVIPNLTNTPKNLPQQAASNNENEVAVLIDNKRFRFWSSITVIRSIDSIDTVEFIAPFESNLPEFREIFKPFTYKNITVTVGGLPLFTGTVISIDPVVETNQRTVSVGCYSTPGVLNDCTPPASSFPLEFDNQGLRDIATTLSSSFGIGLNFEIDQGAIFERVALIPKKKILTFLTELAQQRNLVISSTSSGDLLFQQSVTVGKPVAILQQGSSPLLSITALFKPQEYYSHITGMLPVLVGLAGSQFTVKNPHLDSVIRPITFGVPDTIDADVKAAVNAKIGRMVGNMVAYSIEVSTWRDPLGALWKPNTTLKITAPDAMIYNQYEFIIRSVTYDRSSASETARLNLVLPGAFSGEIPGTLPWDD